KATGQSSKLCHMAHVLIENRNGLVVDATTTTASGTAEREAAIAMVEDVPGSARITLGGDKAYDTQDFVAEMRRLGVTPHVSQHTKGRRSAIDGRTTRGSAPQPRSLGSPDPARDGHACRTYVPK